MKKWRILTKIKQKALKKRQEEIISSLLKNRGLMTKKRIDEFLTPPHPSSFDVKAFNINKKQLEKAVEKIKRTIEKGQKIVVYGDYDADGICGTAILWETLHRLGADVLPYIPHRVTEGYGVSKKGIDNIVKKFNPRLIITVDNGITQAKAIDYAKEKGIEVIISDHHLPPKTLPKAYAIVQTVELSGSGVAWVLARAVARKCHQKSTIARKKLHLEDLLSLVAIGTIADLTPLLGVNRSLVKYGLAALNQTKRVGLQALIDEMGLTLGKIGPYQVSFIIAPRLNATGRLTHALESLRLLCTKDHQSAQKLAQKLGRINRERQKLMEETIVHARSLWKRYSTPGVEKIIFVGDESYNQGVIGLVAGRLLEEFYRPAIVVSKSEEISKASARSINGFNIIQAIRSCSDLLIDCGGHPMAAGFTVKTRYLKSLKEKLEELAQKELDEEKLKKVLKIDCEISLLDITFNLYEQIQKFQPFGLGNPEPVFAIKGVLVLDARVVGREGKHLKLLISNRPSALQGVRSGCLGGGTATRKTSEVSLSTSEVEKVAGMGQAVDAIAFGMGEIYPKLSPEKPIDIGFSLILDEWNSQKKLQLKIKDIHLKS